MKAIFGLGNPGRQYMNNRHNVGYMVVEDLAKRQGLKLKRSLRLMALMAKTDIGTDRFLFIKPFVFMNNSGRCVKKFLTYYKLSAPDILIVYDDIDLPLGAIRFREKGSSGGHRGLDSVKSVLGSEEFDRLKVGIGRPQRGEVSDYVLSDFFSSEKDVLSGAIENASLACMEWLTQDKSSLMRKYNRRGGNQ